MCLNQNLKKFENVNYLTLCTKVNRSMILCFKIQDKFHSKNNKLSFEK